MSTFDWVVGTLLLFGAFKGFKDGFLMSLAMLVGIIVGIIAGFKLIGITMNYLASNFNIDSKVLPYLAFTCVFVLVVIGIYLMGKSIHASIDKTFLGRLDQIAGALLGTIRMLFITSVILWLISSLQMSLPESWIIDSKTYEITKSFAPGVSSCLGDWLPALGDIFQLKLE